MPTLHAIHGFIGAGKTTFAKKLSADLNAMYFCHDEFMHAFHGENPSAEIFNANMKRVDAFIYSHAARLLQLGQDIILDMDFWSRKRRDVARRFAAGNNADFKLYHIDCRDDLAIARAVKRSENLPEDCLFMDEESYYQLKQYFQPLGEDEPYIYINTDE